MTMEERILALAAGIVGGEPSALLRSLCAAAEAAWRGRLRPGVEVETCGEAFCCGAAFTAAAAASTSSTKRAKWGMQPSVMGTGTGDWISSSVTPPKRISASSFSPSGVWTLPRSAT